MNKPVIKPIKRSAALTPLSREHHDSLLMAWKIRAGIRRGISCDRIILYCEWFYKQHLAQHFETEENCIPSIIGSKDTLFLQMIDEHRTIKQALADLSDRNAQCYIQLEAFAKLVTDHVRFEERILYNHIEGVATKDQLESLLHIHPVTKRSEWEDQFWITN